MARASLEELKLDYEDFLRQRSLCQWGPKEPLRQALIDRRCKTADDVATWVMQTAKGYRLRKPSQHQSVKSQASTRSTASTLSTTIYPEISANAVLVLLAVACSLLDRQVARLAQDFENEGGFTERLYRVRSARRRRGKP